MSEFNDDERAVLVELAQNLLAARRILKWLAWLGALSLGFVAALYHLVSIVRDVGGPSPTIHGGG
jgi:hypothetical protein